MLGVWRFGYRDTPCLQIGVPAHIPFNEVINILLHSLIARDLHCYLLSHQFTCSCDDLVGIILLILAMSTFCTFL
jgi:hypothetical protein